MKPFIFLFLIASNLLQAQVGINTTTPNALLEIKTSNPLNPNPTDGLLIPKIDEYPTINPTVGQDGMLVFATGAGTVSKGFYYWDNGTTSWVRARGAKKINDLIDGKSDNDGTDNGSSIFLGVAAGSNDDGTSNLNVGIGLESMNNNLNGHSNVGIGVKSLYSNTTGDSNTAVGIASLHDNVVGSYNTGLGGASLFSNTNGSSNTGVGAFSLYSNTTGDQNSAFGYGSLVANETGIGNVSIGFQSGSFFADLNYNVSIGYRAGKNETNSNRLYIENSDSTTPLIYGEFDTDIVGINGRLGIGTQTPGTALEVNGTEAEGIQDIVATLTSSDSNRPILLFNETADTNLNGGMSIEYDGRGNGVANKMVINGLGGSALFEFSNGGAYSINNGSLLLNHPTGSATQGLILRNAVDTDQWRIYHQWNTNTLALFFNGMNVGNFDDVSGVYSAISDRNRKKNIQPLASVLAKIVELEVVDYNFISQKDSTKHIGFIAQDVEALFPSLVKIPDEDKGNYTLDYSGFGVLAIKAIQEQQLEINTLKELLQKQQEELFEIKALLKTRRSK